MAFYAIAAGAKGINYFMYPTERRPGGKTILHGLGEYPKLCEAVKEINEELEAVAPLIPISHPVNLARTDAKGLRTWALLYGPEAVLVVLINENYRSVRDGFEVNPVKDVRVSLPVLPWLKPREVVLLSKDSAMPLPVEEHNGEILLRVGEVNTAKLVLISAREGLAKELLAQAKARREWRTKRLHEIVQERERRKREQKALKEQVLTKFKDYAVRSVPIRAYGIAREQLWNPQGEKWNAWEWYDEKGGKRYGVSWKVSVPAERAGKEHIFYVNLRLVGIPATLRLVDSKGKKIAERKIEPSSEYRVLVWHVVFPTEGEYRIELVQEGKGYEHGKVAKVAFVVPHR